MRKSTITSARALLLALYMPLCIEAQSATPPQLLGSVDNGGSAHPAFSWNGAEWQLRVDDVPEGTPVVVVDTLGRRSGLVWLFNVVGIEELVDVEPFTTPEDMAYVTSPDVEHAPFLPVESPLSVAEWDVLLSTAHPSRDVGSASRLDVRVWTAHAGNHSLTYFAIHRVAASTACPARYQFTGWFPPGASEPVILTNSDGDCDGKGLLSRRPFGLIVRDGRPALAIGVSGWESGGVELWELVDGQLQMQAAESHT
jgi:hypothetical protein